MTAEIAIPFALDVHGSVAVTTDPDVQQAQHVSSLVTTQPGERVMRPKYGVPTMKYLFGNNGGNVTALINKDVQQAMSTWEPGITVNSVTPVWNNQGGIAEIDVDYLAAPEDTGAVQTAVINVGGSVTIQ
jgi:hypothetical protein